MSINNEKHYKESNPDLDMKNVSDDVLSLYLSNEKFDMQITYYTQ